mgnify:CR=1 FL=1
MLKFRLYPNKNTEFKLLETLNLCRQMYNLLLDELQNQKIIDKAMIQGLIPDIKICDPNFNKVYSKVLQYESYKLFSNLRSLSNLKKSNRKVGSLRFKGKGSFKTFTYNQSGFKINFTGKRHNILRLSKIGDIPIRCHRNINGKIKEVVIKREPSGKWFAFICEDILIEKHNENIKNVVCIDVGLINIVHDSDNNKIVNPRHLNKYAVRLAHLQRIMSKKKIGSKNREKMGIRLARQYEKLGNTRNDFLHKLSRYYINNYDAIGMEDMPVNKMVKGNLAKSILDASWGKLRQFMFYKAESAGKTFITVDYRGTTLRCSQCGTKIKKELRDRIHKCNYCGFEAQRDYNSALEIKRLTLIEIGQELPESTHAEMGALPAMATPVCET